MSSFVSRCTVGTGSPSRSETSFWVSSGGLGGEQLEDVEAPRERARPTARSRSAKLAFAYRLWEHNRPMDRAPAESARRDAALQLVRGPGGRGRRARAHLPALVAVRRALRRARRARQLLPHPGGRPARGGGARPRWRAARLPQRLPPPRHDPRGRAADARHDPVPVPRLDLRPRRHASAERRGARRSRASTRTSSASRRCRWTPGGRSCS